MQANTIRQNDKDPGSVTMKLTCNNDDIMLNIKKIFMKWY